MISIHAAAEAAFVEWTSDTVQMIETIFESARSIPHSGSL
jgi:hypothetical protein